MQSTAAPVIARDMESLQLALAELAEMGKTVALVPTMGALHAGHLSLVTRAGQLADSVVVSIFVNPKQFGANEDLAKYPRQLEKDIQLLHDSVAIVYAPAADDLYPEGYATSVSAGLMSQTLCGQFRPGHFDGVATVVTKLLLRTLPHAAVFGEKDYQQLCVIQRVVQDLDIAVDIVGVETMRESDGLALSSRNVYLNAQERALAPKIYETLQMVAQAIRSGSVAVKAAVTHGVETLKGYGFKVDYLELREAQTLQPLEKWDMDARLLVAAWLGNTRLIDNIAVE